MTPRRFTPRYFAHSSGSVSTKRVGVPKPSVPALPALLTRMSTPSTPATASWTAAWSVTSKGSAAAVPPVGPDGFGRGLGPLGEVVVDQHLGAGRGQRLRRWPDRRPARRRSPVPACPPGRSRWSCPLRCSCDDLVGPQRCDLVGGEARRRRARHRCRLRAPADPSGRGWPTSPAAPSKRIGLASTRAPEPASATRLPRSVTCGSSRRSAGSLTGPTPPAQTRVGDPRRRRLGGEDLGEAGDDRGLVVDAEPVVEQVRGAEALAQGGPGLRLAGGDGDLAPIRAAVHVAGRERAPARRRRVGGAGHVLGEDPHGAVDHVGVEPSALPGPVRPRPARRGCRPSPSARRAGSTASSPAGWRVRRPRRPSSPA